MMMKPTHLYHLCSNEVPREESLPGLGIGMTIYNFQITWYLICIILHFSTLIMCFHLSDHSSHLSMSLVWFWLVNRRLILVSSANMLIILVMLSGISLIKNEIGLGL